jgi:hypothetical protein
MSPESDTARRGHVSDDTLVRGEPAAPCDRAAQCSQSRASAHLDLLRRKLVRDGAVQRWDVNTARDEHIAAVLRNSLQAHSHAHGMDQTDAATAKLRKFFLLAA